VQHVTTRGRTRELRTSRIASSDVEQRRSEERHRPNAGASEVLQGLSAAHHPRQGHRPRSFVVFLRSRRLGNPRSFQVDQDSPSGAFAKSYAFRKNQELSISPSEREV
jgi:hypothetical protein